MKPLVWQSICAKRHSAVLFKGTKSKNPWMASNMSGTSVPSSVSLNKNGLVLCQVDLGAFPSVSGVRSRRLSIGNLLVT